MICPVLAKLRNYNMIRALAESRGARNGVLDHRPLVGQINVRQNITALQHISQGVIHPATLRVHEPRNGIAEFFLDERHSPQEGDVPYQYSQRSA